MDKIRHVNLFFIEAETNNMQIVNF